MADTFEVRIDNLAYGGDALGRLADGRVIFVPYAMPGELVRIKILEEKPRHARGELLEVLETSPGRVAARCVHFMTCGGCHYQHMDYTSQLMVKSAILQEQLERIGGLHDLPPIARIASPEPWNYRNHVQFHLTREGKLGFQKAHSNQPFAIRECHLPEPVINWLWRLIDIEPMRGTQRVNIRSGVDDDLIIILEGDDPQPVELNIENLPISVVQTGASGSLVLAGSDRIIMEVSGRRFNVSVGSFFQVNLLQAEAIVRYLMDHLSLRKDMTVLDAYSGVGLFSAFLAPRVKRLVGIEASPEACEDFTTNLDEFENVELYEATVEEVFREVHFSPDAIIMDPPRAGLGVKTVEGILSQGAHLLGYVSCDPATLARDGKQLAAGGYSLVSLVLVDMFPQTYHIESISVWEREEI